MIGRRVWAGLMAGLIGWTGWGLYARGVEPLEIPEEKRKEVFSPSENPSAEPVRADGTAVATFAGGCFWCTEAVFLQLKGVKSVVSGYIGGKLKNPTYEQVCTGATGHAEAIQITYDPKVISFVELLEVFWSTHDPTTLNRQGNDVGTQYRSAVFFHDEEQKQLAETYKKKLDDAKAFAHPIVTTLEPATTFYSAEKYHQDYFNRNPNQGYCAVMIKPKVDKVRKVFRDKLKPADAAP
jgi:peptide-methionine (S)-S-oxide reductase